MLDVRMEPGGERLYVEGEPIHAGDALELRCPDGAWVRGRYEYQIDGRELRALWLYVPVHGRMLQARLGNDDEVRLPRGDR